MRLFHAKLALLSTAATILLAGCAGGSLIPTTSSPVSQNQSHVTSGSLSPLAAPPNKGGAPYDIYVADVNGSVGKIPRGCVSASCVVAAGTGFSCPSGASLDKHGDLIVSTTCDYGTAVYKLPPGCSKSSCASSE